jgi:S-adenosylmethionine-diacylglycerol 3-amino-3-carboxypropyl transferase
MAGATLATVSAHDDTPAICPEVAAKAAFDGVRYAQGWEDADVLLDGLAISPGDTCVSIAAAGDNALAMLIADPARVIALDLSDAQLACTALRIAAYRTLDHGAFLELLGARASQRRGALYARCRAILDEPARAFWDARPGDVARGIAGCGKFERYLELFRTRLLPLAHGRTTVAALFEARTRAERERFYREVWNTPRWRMLFRVFFSRTVMGRLGRDPRFFDYVTDDVAAALLARAEHALVTLDPSCNPYLRRLFTGDAGDTLPLAWRAEHFATIRERVDRVALRRTSLEAFARESESGVVDRWNLSDLFEYVSPENYEAMLRDIVRASHSGARLAYWNMLVPRTRPSSLAHALRPLQERAARLHAVDRACFYRAFVLEEVV